MSPLEQLFRHEVEFHRLMREAADPQGGSAIHTSFALQHGYETLIRSTRTASGNDVEALKVKLSFAVDARDVLAAQDSVKRFLGISPHRPVTSE